MSRTSAPNELKRAGIKDTLAFVAEVIVPTIGKGVLIRRPRSVALAERLGLDTRAVRRMQRLRETYGSGPLLLAIPGRRQAVILSPDDLRRVLDETPEPFSPASAEKRAALAHFEPDVSLVSQGPDRAQRRRFNEKVLESDCPVHSLAETFLAAAEQEVELLLSRAGAQLMWEDFITAWYALVRRIVLGDSARDDHELTDKLAKLRAAGNWAFFHPGRRSLLTKVHQQVEKYISRGEQGSLAGLIASMPTSERMAPVDQVAHWLFAFDPGAMATLRALALLASHPAHMQRARREIEAADRRDVPLLRASILESLRLWPTTPLILRETTQDTRWDGGIIPRNTNLVIFAPYFHRDDRSLPQAHRFDPDLWLDGDPERRLGLVPFSGGPGACPARQMVTMLGSRVLAAILKARDLQLEVPEGLGPDRPLPGTLDNYSLRFALQGRTARARPGTSTSSSAITGIRPAPW